MMKKSVSFFIAVIMIFFNLCQCKSHCQRSRAVRLCSTILKMEKIHCLRSGSVCDAEEEASEKA